jgi:hypothetical protein
VGEQVQHQIRAAAISDPELLLSMDPEDLTCASLETHEDADRLSGQHKLRASLHLLIAQKVYNAVA